MVFYIAVAAFGVLLSWFWVSGMGLRLLLAMNALATEYNNQYSVDDDNEKDE